MPSSSVRTFTDPDEYAVTVRPPPNDGPASMTLIGSGNFTGKLVRIDLHRLWMQRFYDNLPRIGHAANMVPSDDHVSYGRWVGVIPQWSGNGSEQHQALSR